MAPPNLSIASIPAGSPYIGPGVPAPTPRAPTAAGLTLAERIAYADLLARVDGPVTRNAPPLIGSMIGNSTAFILVYQNTSSWPVAVRLEADTINNTIRLNFYAPVDLKPSDNDFRDYLNSGVGGATRLVTRNIYILPTRSLYVKRLSTWGTPDANDTIRVGVIDPQVILQPAGWPSNGG